MLKYIYQIMERYSEGKSSKSGSLRTKSVGSKNNQKKDILGKSF